MVVQGCVEVGVTGSGPVAPAFGPADALVSAAVGDPAEFLDGDVEEFARAGAFVAADRFAGRPVAERQGGQAVPDEDPMGGRGCGADAGREPQRPDPVLVTQADEAFFNLGRGAAWLVVGTAGAVAHSGDAELSVASGPPGGGGVADLETLRRPAPAVFDDASVGW